jgi:hypothetical protein
MSDPNEFDRSFYVLSILGYLVVGRGYLETSEGREIIRNIFQAAMTTGASESLAALAEFRAAMADCEAAESGVPIEQVIEARVPGLLARTEGA